MTGIGLNKNGIILYYFYVFSFGSFLTPFFIIQDILNVGYTKLLILNIRYIKMLILNVGYIKMLISNIRYINHYILNIRYNYIIYPTLDILITTCPILTILSQHILNVRYTQYHSHQITLFVYTLSTRLSTRLKLIP